MSKGIIGSQRDAFKISSKTVKSNQINSHLRSANKHYPVHSAARVLTKKVPTANPDDTVTKVLRYLRLQSKNLETLSYIYILSNKGRLKGVAAIKSILKAKDDQIMKDIMSEELITVHPYTDQEKAAILAIENNIKAIPVVDKQGTFQGVIPTDRILNILHQEHIEDILKLSGIDVGTLKASSELSQHASASIRMRLPWLLLGLAGGLISTWIVSRFGAVIEQLIILAFFMPIITYLSGAIANQTLSILIRNIIMTKINIKQYLAAELVTGTLIGGLLGLILSLASFIWFSSYEVALIIILTMIFNAFISTSISVAMPWLLNKLDKDPALAAGPFAIMIQDMSSLIVYFTIAVLVLKMS